MGPATLAAFVAEAGRRAGGREASPKAAGWEANWKPEFGPPPVGTASRRRDCDSSAPPPLPLAGVSIEME